MLFGERVREARERSGLMNRDFAALVGVTAPYVSQIIRGQTAGISPRLREAIKIWEVDITGLPEPFSV
jgi:transcriptional regulator with XRE-family HTH domain